MNIQTDYSTLSTSLTPSEMAAANLIYDVMENLPETESSEESRNSSEENAPTLPPPKDNFKMVYLATGLFGITGLLPWNFFIAAHDYWMYKFRNVTYPIDIPGNRTDLQASFTTYIALAMNIPNVITLLCCMFVSTRIARNNVIAGSLLFLILSCSIITSLVYIDTDPWQETFFILTMFLVVVVGITTAVFQASLGGVFSVFPAKYLHIMVLGQAIAGIFATVILIISLLGHCNPIKSSFVYFLCGDIVLLAAFLVYLVTCQSSFFHYYRSGHTANRAMKDVSSAHVKINIPFMVVMRRVWPFAVCSLLTFLVTIGIYPGVAVLVISEQFSNGSIWTGALFVPLVCFALFNFGDLFGRILAGWLKLDPASHRYRLLILSVIRIVFIPLFLLCNVQPRDNLPVIFGDIAYICFMSLFGLSNGYISTLAMIAGTKCVNTEMQHTASVILFAFLGLGLMAGSLLSYGFVQVL